MAYQREGIIPFVLSIIRHRRKMQQKPELDAAKEFQKQQEMAQKMLLSAYGKSPYEADMPDYGTAFAKALKSMSGEE
jgi:hypothetical protein